MAQVSNGKSEVIRLIYGQNPMAAQSTILHVRIKLLENIAGFRLSVKKEKSLTFHGESPGGIASMPQEN